MAATNHKMAMNRARGTVRSLPGQEIAENPRNLLDLRKDCMQGTRRDYGQITISHI